MFVRHFSFFAGVYMKEKAKRQALAIGDANWDKPRRKTASASAKAAVTIRSNDRLVDKQREHNKAH